MKGEVLAWIDAVPPGRYGVRAKADDTALAVDAPLEKLWRWDGSADAESNPPCYFPALLSIQARFFEMLVSVDVVAPPPEWMPVR
jgi:hypothetical protein